MNCQPSVGRLDVSVLFSRSFWILPIVLWIVTAPLLARQCPDVRIEDVHPDSVSFGSEIATSGEVVMVSDPGWNGSIGRVHVYAYDETNQWSSVQTIYNDNGYTDSRFGETLALSEPFGSTFGKCTNRHNTHHHLAAIGSPGEYYWTNGASGAVYVYYFEEPYVNTCFFTLRAALKPYDGGQLVITDTAEFGSSLSMSSDFLVAGAPGNDYYGTNVGGALVYSRASITSPTSEGIDLIRVMGFGLPEHARFGSSVAVDGDWILVGAPGDRPGAGPLGNSAGSVYAFHVSLAANPSDPPIVTYAGRLPDISAGAWGSQGRRVALGGGIAWVEGTGESAHKTAAEYTWSGSQWSLKTSRGAVSFSLRSQDDGSVVGSLFGNGHPNFGTPCDPQSIAVLKKAATDSDWTFRCTLPTQVKNRADSASAFGSIVAIGSPSDVNCCYFGPCPDPEIGAFYLYDLSCPDFAPPTVDFDVDPTGPVCPGFNVHLSASASGNGLSYQWYADDVAIAGATAASFTDTPTSETTYFVRVTDWCQQVAESSHHTVTMKSPPAFAGPPAVNPSTPVCPDDPGITVSFEVSASGSEVSYSWYKDGSPPQAITDGGRFSGAETNRLVITGPSASDAGSYYARATDECGQSEPSELAVLQLKEPASIGGPPIITPALACPGGTVRLSIVVNGDPAPQVEWFHESDLATPIGTGAVFQIHNVSTTDAGGYLARVHNDCNATESSSETLIVEEPRRFTSALPEWRDVCEGTVLEIDAQFEPVDAEIEWFRVNPGSGGDQQVGSGNPLHLEPIQLAEAGDYYARLVSHCDPNVESTRTNVQVDPLPSIIVQPDDAACGVGNRIVLSVVATNADTYRWLCNGIEVAQGPSPDLVLDPVVPQDAGEYEVLVSNSQSSCSQIQIPSTRASLTVFDAPASLDASDGSRPDGIQIDWTSVDIGGLLPHYQIYRSVDDQQLNAQPIFVDWQTGTSWLDSNPILHAGFDYHYWAAAALDADGLRRTTISSATDTGYIALQPPFNLTATQLALPYVAVSWSPVKDATYYGVFRAPITDVDNKQLLGGQWLLHQGASDAGQTYFDLTAVPEEGYRYTVKAATDPQGGHSSAESASADGQRFCGPMPACGPGGPAMLLLLDRSQYMEIASRNDSSLTAAEQDVIAFFNYFAQQGVPGAGVEVWIFGNDCLSSLTEGFVDQEAALAAIESLRGTLCAGSSPLAEALCQGGWRLFNCRSSAPHDNRILNIQTAGKNDFFFQDSCLGPNKFDSQSGDSCGTYDIGSWQQHVCFFFFQNGSPFHSVLVRHWEDSGLSSSVSGATFLSNLAEVTGGQYFGVSDSDLDLPSFFGDCNANGIDDYVDIANGTSADCNGDRIPDECQLYQDCDFNGVPDSCDIADGILADADQNGKPDLCQGFTVSAPPILIAGLPANLVAVSAPPNADVAVVARVLGSNPGPSGAPGFGQLAKLFVWQATADSEGVVRLTRLVPEAMKDQTIQVRAFTLTDLARKTPSITVRIH